MIDLHSLVLNDHFIHLFIYLALSTVVLCDIEAAVLVEGYWSL